MEAFKSNETLWCEISKMFPHFLIWGNIYTYEVKTYTSEILFQQMTFTFAETSHTSRQVMTEIRKKLENVMVSQRIQQH